MGVESVVIPNHITSIGNLAFRYCTGLTSVTIPEGITSIGELAFNGCNGIASVEIPSSVMSIGNHAFSECSSLASVTVKASTPPDLGGYGFAHNNEEGRKIYVPNGKGDAYKNATNWSTYADDIVELPE